jgi:hypothetical protein
MQNHRLVEELIFNVLSNTPYGANITMEGGIASAISARKAHGVSEAGIAPNHEAATKELKG